MAIERSARETKWLEEYADEIVFYRNNGQLRIELCFCYPGAADGEWSFGVVEAGNLAEAVQRAILEQKLQQHRSELITALKSTAGKKAVDTGANKK